MPLAPGHRLGPYEILAAVGAGGMGEVYRARDTRLDRVVAIKVLPDTLASDREFRDRFDREARAISSLDHPHICTLYDVGEQGGTAFLVMQYLEGETLEARLKKGALPLEHAQRYAIQIADALDKAHRAGIVHRDLKPGNVMLTKAGAKLLDFGLAKATRVGGPAESMLATAPASLTAQGTILGTMQYMAPEQLEGQEADARTDIFAFGAVVYEMITARKAFEGKSQATLIGAILHVDPAPIAEGQPLAPPLLEHIVSRCLAKDPGERWQSAGDVMRELTWAAAAPTLGVTPIAGSIRRVRRERILWASAVAVVLLAAGAALVRLRRAESASVAETRFEITTPPTSDPISLAISPDARRIVFVAPTGGRPALWVRSLDSLAPRPLAGTEGAFYPFWSPDSQSIGFFADSKVKRIDINDGLVRAIADAPNPLGAAWNTDGTILFTPNFAGPIYRVSDNGGDPAPLTRLEKQQSSHRFPRILPGGRFLFYVKGGGNTQGGVYLGRLDGGAVRLLESDAAAAYAPSGHLFFVRESKLFAQPFDAAQGALAGRSVPIAEQVVVDEAASVAAVGVSHAGSLVYRSGVAGSQRQLMWFDRAGHELQRIGEPDSSNPMEPAISPDGRQVLLDRAVSGNVDIWRLELARGLFSRVTSDAASEATAIWSPDGKRVLFNSDRSGVYDIYVKPSTGDGREELLLSTPLNKAPTDWSPDGRFVLFRSPAPATGFDIWALPLFGDRTPFPVVQTRFDERDAMFAPDGKWIAYQSNESGRTEIYVQPFPGPGDRVQVSTAGGAQVRWRRDGQELFYIGLDERLMAVSIRLEANGERIEPGPPAPLFATRIGGAVQQTAPRQQYDVSGDGQRFLLNTILDQRALPITVIVNWKPPPSQ